MKIKNDIKSKNFTKVYLLYGQEDYLKDYYGKMLIKSILKDNTDDFNLKKYTSSEPDIDEIESFFMTYPFMSEKKAVYIKESGIFKKTNEDAKKRWLELFKDLPDFAVIIFSEKEIDKRNSLYKLVAGDFSADEFPIQKDADLTSWIIRYFALFDKNISDKDAQYMLETCSKSMYILKSEIEKLVFYKNNSKFVTREDIENCSYKIPQSRVFAMIDDILSQNIKNASEKLNELKLLKEEPIALSAAVFSKYSSLRKEKIMSKKYSPREIAFKTGQKEYFVNIHLNQLKNISLEKINEVIKYCNELDNKIKSGLSDGWTEFEILFSKMLY